MLIDLYVRDKTDGYIHKVGSDVHDSLYVDSSGVVRYYNLQNSDGSSDGYEFVPYDSCVDELNPVEQNAKGKS